MTTSFSEKEILDIGSATMLVGLAVAAVDLGIFSTAMESVALSKEILGAVGKYPNNTLIQAAFSETAVRNLGKASKPNVTPEEVTSGAVVDKAITAVNDVVAAIGDKASATEIQEFKTLIYAVGEAVANAAGSGMFGSGAEKVSPEEAAALAKIKAALGV
jgi:hypothetical protein